MYVLDQVEGIKLKGVLMDESPTILSEVAPTLRVPSLHDRRKVDQSGLRVTDTRARFRGTCWVQVFSSPVRKIEIKYKKKSNELHVTDLRGDVENETLDTNALAHDKGNGDRRVQIGAGHFSKHVPADIHKGCMLGSITIKVKFRPLRSRSTMPVIS